tara:strand:- start:2498 stop:3058 length:561 start_codon:yes stop_codon:yes gene_type:complete
MKFNKKGYSTIGLEKNFLSKDECDRVISKGERAEWQELDTPQNYWYPLGSGARKVQKIRLLPDIEKRMRISMDNFNYHSYNFKLKDGLQCFIAKYDHPTHRIGWHKDDYQMLEDIVNKAPIYRISMSILLNDNFEGGDFEMKEHGIINTEAGAAVLFCAHDFHRVNNMIKGKRYSLNVWRHGIRSE